jgi:hypothetical protein
MLADDIANLFLELHIYHFIRSSFSSCQIKFNRSFIIITLTKPPSCAYLRNHYNYSPVVNRVQGQFNTIVNSETGLHQNTFDRRQLKQCLISIRFITLLNVNWVI